MTTYDQMGDWLKKKSRKAKARHLPTIRAVHALVDAAREADRALAATTQAPAAPAVYDPPRSPGYLGDGVPPASAPAPTGDIEFTMEQVDERAKTMYIAADEDMGSRNVAWCDLYETGKTPWREQAQKELRTERMAQDLYEESVLTEQHPWSELEPEIKSHYLTAARSAR